MNEQDSKDLRNALSVEPPEGSTERTWARVQAGITTPPIYAGAERRRSRARKLIPAAVAAALVLVLGASSAVASEKATPDSGLYPVKRAFESVRLAVATSDADEASFRLDRATRRLDEAQSELARGRFEVADDLIKEHTEEIETVTAKAERDEKVAERVDPKLEKVTSKSLAVLRANYEKAPEAAKKGLATAIAAHEKGKGKAADRAKGPKGEKGKPKGAGAITGDNASRGEGGSGEFNMEPRSPEEITPVADVPENSSRGGPPQGVPGGPPEGRGPNR